jgi:hypothetical protein
MIGLKWVREFGLSAIEVEGYRRVFRTKKADECLFTIIAVTPNTLPSMFAVNVI